MKSLFDAKLSNFIPQLVIYFARSVNEQNKRYPYSSSDGCSLQLLLKLLLLV